MPNITGFDATQVDTTDNYQALPSGWYFAMITESEEGASEKGSYIKLVLEGTRGDAQNRKFWKYLSLGSSNPTAVEIARKDLAKICLATGVPTPNDTFELHNIELQVKLGVEEYQGDLKNVVKDFKAASESTEAATAGAGSSGGNFEF